MPRSVQESRFQMGNELYILISTAMFLSFWRQVWANSVDPDRTAPSAVWSGSTLFAIRSASFEHITPQQIHIVQFLAMFLVVWSFRIFIVSLHIKLWVKNWF